MSFWLGAPVACSRAHPCQTQPGGLGQVTSGTPTRGPTEARQQAGQPVDSRVAPPAACLGCWRAMAAGAQPRGRQQASPCPSSSALSLPCRHSESALQVCRCVLRPAGVHRGAPTPATSSSGFYRPAWVHGSGTLGRKLLGEMPSSKREGAGIALPGKPPPWDPTPPRGLCYFPQVPQDSQL